MSYPIVRAVRPSMERQSLEEFAMLSGLHPDLIRRLVALGLVADLLDRIAVLEAALRVAQRRGR